MFKPPSLAVDEEVESSLLRRRPLPALKSKQPVSQFFQGKNILLADQSLLDSQDS